MTLHHPPEKPAPFRGRQAREMDEKQANALRSVPVRLQGVLRRAYAGGSLRAAVTAKCWECYGFDDVHEVRDCRATECPLHSVRPYRQREDGAA